MATKNMTKVGFTEKHDRKPASGISPSARGPQRAGTPDEALCAESAGTCAKKNLTKINTTRK
jgi:hypothetical protein